MGLLSDIYSYSDGLKRKLGGLISDPAGTIDLGVRRFGEDQQGLLSAMQTAYPMRGEKSVMVTPKQKALAKGLLADYGAQSGMAAATVYHGSPHKFDKFDSSKIGTGEGAQAYGHGLYLAEHPDVALNYAPRDPRFEQRILGAYKQAEARQLYPAMEVHEAYLLHKTPQEVEQMIAGMEGLSAAEKVAAQQAHKFGAQQYRKQAGNLYKVDLPDDAIAKMLDWDKPLSQQAPEVRALFNKNAPTYEDPFLASLKQMGIDAKPDPIVGKSIYEKLGTWNKLNQAGVSDLLRNQGIPGIRYLDGGSRGAGTGTSNYVLFPGNEGLLQILERNGAPIR